MRIPTTTKLQIHSWMSRKDFQLSNSLKRCALTLFWWKNISKLQKNEDMSVETNRMRAFSGSIISLLNYLIEYEKSLFTVSITLRKSWWLLLSRSSYSLQNVNLVWILDEATFNSQSFLSSGPTTNVRNFLDPFSVFSLFEVSPHFG